jgi:hypothetical protein
MTNLGSMVNIIPHNMPGFMRQILNKFSVGKTQFNPSKIIALKFLLKMNIYQNTPKTVINAAN